MFVRDLLACYRQCCGIAQLYGEMEPVLIRLLGYLGSTAPPDIVSKVGRVLNIWLEREVVTSAQYAALSASLNRFVRFVQLCVLLMS